MQSRRVYINPHNNLLSLEEKIYELVDVKDPNVFRNLFPYSEIPKIAFNDRIVPHNFPEDIFITDTTSENQVRSALDEINQLNTVKNVDAVLRVE